ncbi:MAG: EamA family transporter, partial [Hyphomicrobiales bacterium]
MSARKQHLDLLAIALLVVLCASWGVQQVIIKLSIADVSPVMQAAIRSSGAGLIIWLWMIARRQPVFQRDGTLWWGLGAGLLFGLEFLLLYWGLTFTHASRAVIFLYLSPFVVAIGAHVFI